ncbi:MAG TPA: ferric reductase-like transmembrane domain-containing protein [Acidimicrobiales bacterium]|nr:ferric reductase-like transmembrane domain-containing protein [Acidimicrobiales bacterium]
MIAAVSSHSRVLWYLTRGSGLVALVLLTASVVLGIVEVQRWATARWPRFVTAALHKNVSLLAVVFLGVHIATTVVDGFAPIGWIDAVLPFRSPYRPVWLGLGALAVDLLLALVITSLLRGRIGYRAWKAVHWAAYACWPVAVLHGMGTGTDTRLGFVLLLYFACLATVVLAVWWRLAGAFVQDRAAGSGAVAAAIASVAVPVGILAFLFAGPLKPGWSRRAGTPSSLVTTAAVAPAATPTAGAAGASTGGRPPAAAPPGGAAAPSSGFTGAFADSLAGTITQSADGTSVTIDGALSGAAPGRLHIVLHGQPANGGGVQMTSSGASLGPASRPALYQGSVRSLEGSRLGLALAGPSGTTLHLRVQLALSGGTSVTGTVSSGTGVSGDD